MKQLLFATTNQHKIEELQEILKGMPYQILSLKEAGVTQTVEETGTTFLENAILKAKNGAAQTGEICLADDSGLEVDYLDGAPGIYSARFLGEDTSYEIKNQFILDALKNATNKERTARFVCAMALAKPDGSVFTAEGVLEGEIAFEIRGKNGFGYDPIFWLPQMQCTTAELSMEEKNKRSHRGQALRKIKSYIEQM